MALRLGVAPGFVQINDPVTFAYREHPDSAMKDIERTLAGAWSLVAQIVIQRFFEIAILWGVAGRRIGLSWSRRQAH